MRKYNGLLKRLGDEIKLAAPGKRVAMVVVHDYGDYQEYESYGKFITQEEYEATDWRFRIYCPR